MSSNSEKAPPLREDVLKLLVAEDQASIRVAAKVRQLAANSSSVMIRGESGVGKSLTAWMLHEAGLRRFQPLVVVECATLPAEFLEHDLFGDAGLRSRFELAGEGTIVLNEVAALSMKLQAQLFNSLDRSEIARAGQRISLNARIIATSAVDLERAIARRTLREDLYYRLSTTTLQIPALRDRPGDIPVLAERFLTQLAHVYRRSQPSLSEEALAGLRDFAFPGNVRQLRTILERSFLASTSARIEAESLPNEVRPGSHRPMMTLEELERGYIAEVLERTGGTKSKAAELLGISRKTLLEKRKRYGLDLDKSRHLGVENELK